MSKIIRMMRVNIVSLNLGDNIIEPSDTFYHFHPDCYDRWSKRQLKTGLFSYSMAELEIDTDNVKDINCHSCKQPMYREVIDLG